MQFFQRNGLIASCANAAVARWAGGGHRRDAGDGHVPLPLIMALCILAATLGCSPQLTVRKEIIDAGGAVRSDEGRVIEIDVSDVSNAAALLGSLPRIETVEVFEASRSDVDDATINGLTHWPLVRLNLQATAVKNADVLSHFPNLRWLSVTGTQIRDHSPLIGLQELRTLGLSPHASDESLKLLKHWPNLATLYASGTKISGVGLAEITPRACPHLQTLYLGDTSLEDEDVLRLPIHEALERLSLRDTRAGDQTAAHLAKFPRLDYLDFSLTTLTDEGLQSLAALKSLYVLDLDGTHVTLAGLKRLQMSRPDVRLSHRLLTPKRTQEEEDLEWLEPALRPDPPTSR